MRVVRVTVRDFRCYERACAELGAELTVVTGPNGAGKSNLLEAVYFGCTGRSYRTASEREVIRFGQSSTRVVVNGDCVDGPHELTVGFAVGEPKRMRVDGADVERLLDVTERPLVSVFHPERLGLVKGVPSVRRAHLDQFVAALWPARAATRRAYAQALAQRNALLARIRSGAGERGSLHSWDQRLAACGIALMADRDAAVQTVADSFRLRCGDLGLGAEAALAYSPRSRASDAEQLAAELRERADRDIERGFSGHGPHRDDLLIARQGRELRAYGSQGEQRLALLALLLAERGALASYRAEPPLLLLDDVMSELDAARRAALVGVLRDGAGQVIVTATEPEQVPGARDTAVAGVVVQDGRVLHGVPA